MCGIIAADSPIASVVRVLPEGLHHREYRGYDSAGIASYWLESLTSNPCPIEIADEYRCRHSVPNPDQIIVAISKSGETSNTLAVLRYAKNLDHSRMRANRNVRGSALVHECALRFITRAEPEISVTSAKAFTTQQATLLLLTLLIHKTRGIVGFGIRQARINALRSHYDATLEVSDEEPAEVSGLCYNAGLKELAACNTFIVIVPTPIDEHKQPDLPPPKSRPTKPSSTSSPSSSPRRVSTPRPRASHMPSAVQCTDHPTLPKIEGVMSKPRSPQAVTKYVNDVSRPRVHRNLQTHNHRPALLQRLQ